MLPIGKNQRLPLDPKESKKRQRERWTILLLALLFAALTFTEIRLTKLSTSLPFVNSIFFFGLINLNVVILSALLWLIFKNVGKVFFERRSQILGRTLKAKLVAAFIGFSIIPTLTLFLISVLYINSSFDKWFSLKVQNTLQSSLDIASLYYQNADKNTQHFAQVLSEEIKPLLKKRNPAEIQKFLNAKRSYYDVSAIEFYPRPLDPALIAADPEIINEHPKMFIRLSLDRIRTGFAGKKITFVQNVGNSDLVRSIAPVFLKDKEPAGILVVDKFIPVSLSSRAGEISHVVNDYRETNPLRYPIKTTYLVILILITLLIVFAETWLGLYLAREMTIPIERLVQAADDIGKGRLDISIEKTGHDEIAVLVDSFNRMTRQLREAQANLEKRSLQMEAILTQIETGVVLVDQQGVLLQVNPAARKLLGIDSEIDIDESHAVRMQDLFKGEELLPLRGVLEKALVSDRADPIAQTWSTRIQGEVLNLTSAATPLREEGKIWGAVAVIDDLTMVVKGQRENAWREVAKRIAHEIKNPLTPIKLSAQRMQRRLQGMQGKDGQLVQECTRTIIEHTDELKELVNEFSNFARLPEANPLPNNINEVVTESIHLFGTAHPEVHFTYKKDESVPVFDFDRDQIKRCMMNLFDNAIAAIKSDPVPKVGQIEIQTQKSDSKILITVKDNGPGMPESVQERAFEPYFSTKSEGTGLGLAIVKRIINDHGGYIRIFSKEGEGTTFSIELPLQNPTALRSEA